MPPRDMVARRSNYEDNKDFIPTPPYATRVLFEEVVPTLKNHQGATFYDPAAGEGHMMRVFEEYGGRAVGSDIEPRIEGVAQHDFWSSEPNPYPEADYIITNPPYQNLETFIRKSLSSGVRGVALLTRIQALEGQKRFRLYNSYPPTQVGIFSDRIPFKSGKVVRKAPKMFLHSWVFWDLSDGLSALKDKARPIIWVSPDAQKRYEKDSDYE